MEKLSRFIAHTTAVVMSAYINVGGFCWLRFTIVFCKRAVNQATSFPSLKFFTVISKARDSNYKKRKKCAKSVRVT